MATEGLGLEITELRLGLPGGGPIPAEKKRVFSEMEEEENGGGGRCGKRNQVVGWPPVRSYRRRNSFREKDESETTTKMSYVKVSLDGVPFLRKLDLVTVAGYADLGGAMEKLFGCSIGCSKYTITYEDRDGDWMLVGDVPWKMFTESCRRVRIMKKTEARRSSEMNSLSQ
ncbi:auxin-induced protein 22A-like [Momordica charantia]|uniref:Auxin-responsive protein n=1 Tax=Momordica charantia TaxID=3673 RepID=A0A6J1DL62_MOMCH|nr:auxin-induced protein 22A-like [Momordica charantia]